MNAKDLQCILLRTLCLIVLFSILALPISAQAGPDGSRALGNQVAGSYLLEFNPNPPLVPFRGLATITSDGALILTETTDFGFGNPPVFGFNSPAHGAWKRSGVRDIKIKLLFFNYDDQGAPEVLARVTSPWAFAKGFGSFSGPFTLEAFTLTQDPLDPDETPITVISGTMSGRRIEAD